MNVIGMSWYTPESWERLRAVADDRAKLTYTFEEYTANAEKQIAALGKRGIGRENIS